MTERRPRVAFVLTHSLRAFKADPEGVLGGAEVQVRLLAEAMAGDVDVRVVGMDVGALDKPPRSPLVRLVPVPGGPARGRWRFWSLVRYAMRLWSALRSTEADLFIQRCAGYDLVVVFLFARWHRRRVVYHWASDADADGSGILLYSRFRRLFVWTRRRVDLQACQTTAQQAVLRPAERQRSFIVPNALDTSIAWSASPAGSEVLWVGTIRPEWKRPHMFLDLAAALPHRSFRMVGDLRGPPEFQAQFRARLASLPNVRWAGFVLREGLPAVFARARMLVNVSAVEGFPNTFLEAAACGVPIVSLKVDPNGFLARGAGMVLADDARRLAPAVEALFEDGPWASARAAGLRLAADHRPREVSQGYLRLLGLAAAPQAVAAAGGA